MFIVRLIRKIFGLLRSNLTGHEIGLGFCLGILLGCIPLSSWAAVAAVFLITLLFRTSLSAFFIAALLVKTLSFLMDPLLFRLGEFALEGPLKGIFSWMINTPVLALLDLHRYVVAGGILFTLIASALCYPSLYFLSRRYRASILRWRSTSPAFEKFARFPLVRFLNWLLSGEKKGDHWELPETRKNPIRTGAVVLLAAFAVVLCLFTVLFGDALAKVGFETGLSMVTDTEVNTRDLTLGVLQGTLGLEDLFIREWEKKKSIVSAVTLSSDLSVSALLRRRLVFDRISIMNMDFRAERDHEGRFNLGRRKGPGLRLPRIEGPSVDVRSAADFWQQKGLARDVIEKLLDHLFPDVETTLARLEALKRRTLERGEYSDLYAHSLLGGDQPFVVIEDLKIEGLKLKLKDESEKGPGHSFESLTLHATALSSNPVLYKKDSVIELYTGEHYDSAPFRLRFVLAWSRPGADHHLKIQFREIPSDEVVKYIDPGDELVFEGGAVSLESQASFGPEGLDSTIDFRLFNVNVRPVRPKKKILGLEGKLLCRGLTEFLKDTPLTTSVAIQGPYDALKIHVDDKGLIASVEEGIQRTGDRLLQEEMDRQLDRIHNRLDEKLKEGEKRLDEKVEKLEDKLTEKLNRLLGGKKKKKK